jgi:hypothetical protein
MVDLNKVKPENLWYVVGLIAADGNLSPNKRHINITSKDREYLFLIRDALGLQSAVGRKARGVETEKKYSVLQFSDVGFYDYLVNVGLCSKKSLVLGKIEIDSRYFKDFLRGVIDGDGCIRGWVHKSNGHQQWSLDITSAAPVFIRWLKEEIENKLHVKGRLYTHLHKGKKNKINILKFGKLAARVIIREIYYEGALALDRKVAIGKLCLQDKNRMVNYGGILGPGAEIGYTELT